MGWETQKKLGTGALFTRRFQRRKLRHASMYPQCSLRVYTREVDTIRKVSAAPRWRLNIHVEPIIRFYLTHCQRAICFWPSVREMARKEQFSWTDDETELLVNITLDYKTEKIANGIDWESIRSKYGDIWERFSAELARMIEETTNSW